MKTHDHPSFVRFLYFDLLMIIRPYGDYDLRELVGGTCVLSEHVGSRCSQWEKVRGHKCSVGTRMRPLCFVAQLGGRCALCEQLGGRCALCEQLGGRCAL